MRALCLKHGYPYERTARGVNRCPYCELDIQRAQRAGVKPGRPNSMSPALRARLMQEAATVPVRTRVAVATTDIDLTRTR